MQSKFPFSRLEMLDRFLDGHLTNDQKRQLEQELKEDIALQEDLEILRLSRDAIRSRLLADRIHALLQKHKLEAEKTKQPERRTSAKRPALNWMWRMAATFLIGMIGYGGYLLITANPADLYEEKFVDYQLPIARGSHHALTTLDSAYLQENYTQVIQTFSTLDEKNKIDYFLAGMSYMQNHQYRQAIDVFQTLDQQSQQPGAGNFEQELEYYLALAYLQNEQFYEAKAIFKKMRNDVQHLYHKNVSSSDILKLTVLDIKY